MEREGPDPGWTLQIDVGELRRICLLLLDHLSEVAGERVEIDKDYFWVIDQVARFDVYQTPEVSMIGQLSASWSNLRELDKVSVTSDDLVWLADILRTIGEDTVG